MMKNFIKTFIICVFFTSISMTTFAQTQNPTPKSEEKTAALKLKLMDPALAADYEALMDIQAQIDEEEKRQESLLERMLETETELLDFEE